MTTYTWTVESVDASTGNMEVTYTFGETSTRLNLPHPTEGADIAAWVDRYAPRASWKTQLSTVEVGATGEAPVEVPAPAEPAASETPVVTGNWNEEYLRALIYSVLEEVQEQSV